jgi:hypothetical protein
VRRAAIGGVAAADSEGSTCGVRAADAVVLRLAAATPTSGHSVVSNTAYVLVADSYCKLL